jgi:ATP-dependent Lon protease
MIKRKNVFPCSNLPKIHKPNPKEYVVIARQINTLKDIICLGKEYDENKDYNIDMKQLSKLVPSLVELDNMIGMETIKNDIVDHILFIIQKLETHNDMMHTVIQGPPGTGKTEVAKIIGRIYSNLGVIKIKPPSFY